MAGKMVAVEPSDVQVGDIANHRAGLDGRRVTRVAGDQIWIWVLTSEVGPVPKANYEFDRWIDG